jgi:hypothetical protein
MITSLSDGIRPDHAELVHWGDHLDTPARESILRQWQALFAEDSGARADHHPEIAMAGAAARGRSLWLWFAPAEETLGRPSSMAVLEERPFLIRPLPGVRFLQSRICVLRLVGMRLLGDQSDQQAQRMLEALQRHLHSRRGSVQGGYLEEIDEDSAVGRAIGSMRLNLAGRSLVPWALTQPHWYLQFPVDREDYWLKFSGKRRQKLRREQRLCGGTLQVITQPEEIPQFVKGAEFVSERSWQGKDFGLRVRDNATTVESFQHLARLGFFRGYLLSRDGQPVAFTYGTLHSGCYMFEETGYDSSMSSLSPGKVLLMELINDLIRAPGVRMIDFGFGHASYKEQFGTECGAISSWLFLGPHAWPKTMARSKSMYARVRTTMRETYRRMSDRSRSGGTGLHSRDER